MIEFGITHPVVRSHALRGEDSVRPGRKLLLVYSGTVVPIVQTVTAVTGIIEMSTDELWRLRYGKDHSSKEMQKVFLYRKADGTLDYRHASDAGILPYGSASENQFYNKTNYTLDKKALKRAGFSVKRVK